MLLILCEIVVDLMQKEEDAGGFADDGESE